MKSGRPENSGTSFQRTRSWAHRLVWAGAIIVGGIALRAGGAEVVSPPVPPESWQASYDVVIAGAGTGGIGAAIQAARLGASVLLLEETDWIGGQMLAAAVSAMD